MTERCRCCGEPATLLLDSPDLMSSTASAALDVITALMKKWEMRSVSINGQQVDVVSVAGAHRVGCPRCGDPSLPECDTCIRFPRIPLAEVGPATASDADAIVAPTEVGAPPRPSTASAALDAITAMMRKWEILSVSINGQQVDVTARHARALTERLQSLEPTLDVSGASTLAADHASNALIRVDREPLSSGSSSSNSSPRRRPLTEHGDLKNRRDHTTDAMNYHYERFPAPAQPDAPAYDASVIGQAVMSIREYLHKHGLVPVLDMMAEEFPQYANDLHELAEKAQADAHRLLGRLRR